MYYVISDDNEVVFTCNTCKDANRWIKIQDELAELECIEPTGYIITRSVEE